MTQAEKRIAGLRAGLAYVSKAHRPKILAMIAEIEAEQDPKRAAVVDPEPKPPEALEGAVDGAGSSSETNARLTPQRLGERAAPSLRNTGIPGRAGEGDGSSPPIAIGAAAQEPLAHHGPQAETDCRGSGVAEAQRQANFAAAQQKPPRERACQRCGRPLIGKWKAAARYCVPCGNEVARERSAARSARAPGSPQLPGPIHIAGATSAERRAAAALLPAEAPTDPRQPPLEPPRFTLVWDPAIVIGPDRPAPVRRYANGQPAPFQDDLAARADHGSGGQLTLRNIRHSPTGCAAAMAAGAA